MQLLFRKGRTTCVFHPAGKRDFSLFLLQNNCCFQKDGQPVFFIQPERGIFPCSCCNAIALRIPKGWTPNGFHPFENPASFISAGSFRTAPVCGLVCSSMPARLRPEAEEGQSVRCSSRKRFLHCRCRNRKPRTAPDSNPTDVVSDVARTSSNFPEQRITVLTRPPA